MKKLTFGLFVVILFSSCMAFHAGSISSNGALSSANFEYVKKDISGTSSAVYILNIGGMAKEKMVAEAKENMLQKNPLLSNQALVNMSVDYKNTLILGTIYRKLTVTVTADVVEFKK